MSWQEPIVAIIVGLAVVSLYRHLHGLLGSAEPGTPSCHGCDDCADERETGTPTSAPPILDPGSTHIH